MILFLCVAIVHYLEIGYRFTKFVVTMRFVDGFYMIRFQAGNEKPSKSWERVKSDLKLEYTQMRNLCCKILIRSMIFN